MQNKNEDGEITILQSPTVLGSWTDIHLMHVQQVGSILKIATITKLKTGENRSLTSKSNL